MVIDIWRCGPPRSTGRKQGFPARFWTYFDREYVDMQPLLHLCSGDSTDGYTVDSDPASHAMKHYDARQLPDTWDNLWPVVFCDPPYNAGFAAEWPSDYPRPSHLLREMYRVCEPRGTIAMLHILVLPAPRGLGGLMQRVAIHGILSGTNNAIRVLNVYTKQVSDEN